MNILVAGAGVVGESLAQQLSQEGHRVALVDVDRDRLQAIQERLDVLTVHGNASSPSVLERAGVGGADLLIAVTNLDEVNLVVTMLARRMGVPRRIARLRNREFLDNEKWLPLDELGVDQVINPEPVMADALLHMMRIPGASSFARLSGGECVVVGFDILEDSPIVGKTLAELAQLGALESFLVLSIRRDGRTWIPRGGDEIRAGDALTVLVAEEAVSAVAAMVQRSPKDVDRMVIVGASRLGRSIADAAAGFVKAVVLIEPDEALAEEAAEELDRVNVLCGQPTDVSLLEEAGISECDLFCALSADDQTNILAALLAKRSAPTRAAVVVSQPDYVPIVDELGVEIVLNPRLVAVSEILMHVRGGHVHAVTRVSEDEAEVLELTATKGADAVGKPLREVGMPPGTLVAGVLRDGKMRIARGDTVVQPGDAVVVYALPGTAAKAERLFARRGWFGR